jgi:hypothetical protein
MSRPLRVALALVVAVAVAEAVSLVARGSRGDSDFGVFYRTCLLLKSGIGGDLYPRLDPVTSWPISLAPAGLALFQPLASFSPIGASAAWALANLALLGLSVAALRATLRRIDAPGADALIPWATMVLVILAAGSVQVGQFSVVFLACWVAFMHAFAVRRRALAVSLLAVPTAIKLYPVMLLAVPLSLAAGARQRLRMVLVFAAAASIMSLAVPWIAYGGRAWAMNVSFWQHVILAPDGQIAYMQMVRTGSNQSLDAFLLRYLTLDGEFHRLFPGVPHLELMRATVIGWANAARVAIVLTTTAAIWRWRRTAGPDLSGAIVTASAVWSSALYLVLPETKARYAAYAFIAFLPLLSIAIDAAQPPRERRWRAAEVLVCLMLVIGPVPESARAYGLGLAGPVILWIANLRLLGAARRVAIAPRAQAVSPTSAGWTAR